MKPSRCFAALLCWTFGWTGDLSLAASTAGSRRMAPLPVDMAIEWIPYTRPPIQPLGGTSNPHPEKLGRVQTWSLNTEDRRLSMALQRWSAQAGWQLVWEAERDFPIEANIQIQGHFTTALEEVMKTLLDSDYPLQAVMNAQTRVLRVRRQHEGSR